MTTFKNPTVGARGINLKSGVTVLVEAGASLEVDDADVDAFHPDLIEGEGSAPKGDGLPVLAGKNKAALLEIAAAEGVEIEDGATNPDIVSAIELAREAKA